MFKRTEDYYLEILISRNKDYYLDRYPVQVKIQKIAKYLNTIRIKRRSDLEFIKELKKEFNELNNTLYSLSTNALEHKYHEIFKSIYDFRKVKTERNI